MVSKRIKKKASSILLKKDGVIGVGGDDNELRVYIINKEVKRRIESVFVGVPIKFIISGNIIAQ
jgi:hypothetical protein